MNGLYGYPALGSSAIGSLEGDSAGSLEILWLVASGQMRVSLMEQKKLAEKMDANMAKLREALNKAPEGALKQDAWDKYQESNNQVIEVKKKLNQAISAHNEAAEKIATATAGTWSPAKVGMAALPAAGFVVAVAALVLAGGVFIDVLRNWWTGGKTLMAQVEGNINATAKAITAAGGTVVALGDTAIKIALAAGGIFLAWSLYKVVGTRRRRPAAASSASVVVPKVTPALTLKPAEGTVIS